MELKLSLADWLLYYSVPTKLEFIQPNFSHNLIQISKNLSIDVTQPNEYQPQEINTTHIKENNRGWYGNSL